MTNETILLISLTNGIIFIFAYSISLFVRKLEIQD